MLKTAFCEYSKSIKIKISMTCVSKEYEIKTKMVSFLAAVIARLQLKKIFLLVSFYLVGADLTFGEEGIKILWAESLPGGIFPGGGGEEKIFNWLGRLPPPCIPSVGKTLCSFINNRPFCW